MERIQERSKSRFLNLPSTAQWFEKMLLLLEAIPQEPQQQTPSEEKIVEQFQWILQRGDFLEAFLLEMRTIAELQALLKNTTLNEFSYNKALKILKRLDDPDLRIPLQDYLDTAFEETQNSKGPLLLFSDIIESLFGKYKFLAKPNTFSEINRLILLLPTICESITPELVEEAFTQTKNKDVIEFKKEIGPSILAKRREAFKTETQTKQATAQILAFSKQRKEPIFKPHYDNGQKMVGTA